MVAESTSVRSTARTTRKGRTSIKAESTQQAEPKQQTGAQIMCDALEREGVTVLYGYPGGTIMPFYDAISSSALNHVLVRHEQGAAHAADGYARATGKVGVCIGTSGPGATNLVTGLATAFMDSVPVVAITGQVATWLIGTDAFQETDILGVTQAVTKHSILVRKPEDIAAAIHTAFAIARSGRPGPVIVDIPKNVQQATTIAPPEFTPEPPVRGTTTTDIRKAIFHAAELIASAKRPLILAGHGIIISEAYDELRTFAERTGIPVSCTLLGISAFPESHPQYIGWPGMHGRYEVNQAIHHADLLIAVGMRFDDRVTGDISKFAPNAQIIHVDIDPSEMGKVLKPTVPIVADARVALTGLIECTQPTRHDDWVERIHAWRAEAPKIITEDPENPAPQPFGVLAAIKRATDGKAVIVTDVGQHQMWTAGFYGFDQPNTHLTSGGLGTMGFSLPAAMGAAMGRPGEPVWVVAGDGGIQMNIQELATIVALNLPIKVAILNNGYLGMVRQWQEFFYQRNYSETRISGPDYTKLAAAYGATGFTVTSSDEVDDTIAKAIAIDGPVIIDFVIEQGTNVFPMVPPGKANIDMIQPGARS